MKRFFVLTLLLCLFGTGFSQLDCTTFTKRDAQKTALFLWLPTYTGCAAEPTYDIDYRPAMGGAWTSINPFYIPNGGPYDSFFFFGLSACTEYEVRVEVFCQGVSVGTCTDFFRTDGCEELDCNDVTLGNVGTTTADITLTNQAGCTDPVTGEITYEMRVKKSSDSWGAWGQGQTTGTINLTGLDACTDYDYEIRLICNGAPTTVCSGSFTTDCGDCSGITVTNIGDNSADIILDGFDDCRDGGNLGYDLRYRESGGVWTTLSNQVTSGNIYTLTGLNDCMLYEYEVIIKCNGQEVTCSGSFTTTGCEVKPCDGVTIPFVNDNLAYVLFTGFEDCQLFWGGYTVRYWLYNHTTMQWTWNSSNLGQNYFVLQNLDPCTEYTVELEILCGKVWSNVCTVTFMTTGDGCRVANAGNDMQSILDQTPISAFPNPFAEGMTLEFGLAEAGEVSIVLQDMMGKTVYRSNDNYQSGINRVKIDGQNFPAGILFYTVETATEKKTGRVVKQ